MWTFLLNFIKFPLQNFSLYNKGNVVQRIILSHQTKFWGQLVNFGTSTFLFYLEQFLRSKAVFVVICIINQKMDK